MKISVIHPSRGRPISAYATACKWKYFADNEIEYILSLDNDDPELSQYKELFDEFGIGAFGMSNDNKSAIEAINRAAKISSGNLIIVISDDFDCPKSWDTLLISAIHGDAEKLAMYVDMRTDFIVKTQDGLQKTLITLPIMDREYYNRFGYIYHPDYLHMHCDEEMTIVGHMLGRVINVDLLFAHNHYTTGKMQMDAINVKNNSTWAHGQYTLDRRANDNFGIASPLVKREDIVWR